MFEDDAGDSKKTKTAEKVGPEIQKKAEDSLIPEESGDKVEYETVVEEEHSSEKEAPKTPKHHLEDDRHLKGKLKKKEAEIKSLKKEYEELKDKYLRKLAEMENLRKRLERDKLEFEQYALAEFLKELLVVLDNFERAMQSRNQTDGKSFQEGVEMIYRQYLDLLKKKGVSPIEIKDQKFDPTVQQAVLTEEADDVEEPQVAEELQRGYRLHERLLRPALVKARIPKKREGQ